MIYPHITFFVVYLLGFFFVTELLSGLVWNLFDLAYPAPDSGFCLKGFGHCDPNQPPNPAWYAWFFQKLVIMVGAVAIWVTLKGKGKGK